MQNNDVIGTFIRNNPRATIKALLFGACFAWQSTPTVFGIIVYFGIKYYTEKPSRYLAFLLFIAGTCVALQLLALHSLNPKMFLTLGWYINKEIWVQLLEEQYLRAIAIIFYKDVNYLFSLAPAFAAMLVIVDIRLPLNCHKKTLKSLQKGKQLEEKIEKPEAVIKKALEHLKLYHPTATVLGVSKFSAEPILVEDKAINQVVLVLGTTGAGKTITLRRFIDRAIYRKYPLIIVDGKPSDDNVAWIKNLSERNGQPFYGFNCGNFLNYNPLASGGFTELKDKIISLKDQWESDYYRSIAEDYLQTTFEILQKIGKPFDLAKVVDCLNLDNLIDEVRITKDKRLMKRLDSLEQYDRKDITGLQAHLNLLINSELGNYFKINDTAFDLAKAIEENAIVYFALPALRFPSFSKVLGKLVVNDIKSVIDRYDGSKKIFTIFDEFSVFAGDQVLNLVNMGRGKGVHAIFGTQGLADLDKVDASFKDQILNCVNTLICHRLNDQNSAESVANWVGTQDIFTITAQLNMENPKNQLGSVRQNKEFIVHPDSIKQDLKTGEAYLISKVGGFMKDKILVKFDS